MKYLQYGGSTVRWATMVLALLAALMPWWQKPAFAQTATAPQVLSNGVNVGPLSAMSGNFRYFAFNVPAGSTRLTFSMTGGPGDADIYVRYGAVPTTSLWSFRPYTGGSVETVSVNAPQAGMWYVMIHAYTSYSGVGLTASLGSGGGTVTSVAASPTMNPPAGTYSGQVNVALSTSTPNATIRFTVNGSTPTSASEVYAAPIMVTSSTQIRAIAFANGMTVSPVSSANYTIQSTIRTLSNGVAITGLSGAQGSVANFRFAVPSGMSSVSFTMTGSSGDADLYVKYGQLATTSVWDHRPYAGGSNETVTIATPQAGDYYVMVHAYSPYSGVSLRAATSGSSVQGNKPDLVVWGPSMNPYVTTETFATNSCDVEEGTITPGTKRLLRFSTQSRNIGTADLVLGNPANNPSFEWGACHGHYHFKSFAQYRLLDTSGAVVRTGRKVGFCLMDITAVTPGANPSPRYNCSNQGIQAGWADVYSAGLPGQWIDITGLPAGQYVLEVTMDPMNLIDELDESNNTTRINVTVP